MRANEKYDVRSKDMTPSHGRAPPGSVAILGSGETAAVGRRVLGSLLRSLAEPRTIAVLDTPAGFEPNHLQVAEKVAQFITEKLAEFRPRPSIVETRRAALETPPGAAILETIARSRCIVAGPGSPTYMVRELKDTPYLDAMRQAHATGAAVYCSSAASIALSAFSIPVYEIFKVGEDPHWIAGLDFFGPYGMRLAIVPHWNNHEGGEEVDTRFCYMGMARFEELRTKLPSDVVILGIDEHTACLLDFATASVSIDGKGGIHIVRGGHLIEYGSGGAFPMSLLGAHSFDLQQPDMALPILSFMPAEILPAPATLLDPRIEEEAVGRNIPPQLIDALLVVRAELRSAQHWSLADKLRDVLAEFGIVVEDTPTGSRWSLADRE